MKNSYHITALLALSLGLGTASIQAVEKKENVGRIKKQFNESLDRFSRCMQGKCTRWEALKVARDLGIAAVAVAGAIYIGKRALAAKGDVFPHASWNKLEEIKKFYPVGSTIMTTTEELNYKAKVVGYGTQTFVLAGGMSQDWPALEVIEEGRTDKKLILPTQAKRLSLPKLEEE